ncbi:MAG: hypothetical protein DRI46_06790 [Chloroflexi bacterium]|nr:MAG: hypothetical protein DRI46_06790 [Chloroflexota bacterium]
MAYIDHIDPVTRRIYLHSDTVSMQTVNPIDIYKEMRTLRADDESLRPFDVFLSAFGNVSKGGGKFTERYVMENSGTKIIPYDASHTLTINGTIITDDGFEGIYCFDRAPLSPSTIVDINYVPPQVEVIVVSGGSGLSLEEHDWLDEMYRGTGRTIWLDTTAILSGDGSVLAPFNSVALAVDYANLKGIEEISVGSDITLDRDAEGLHFTGNLIHTFNVAGYSIDGAHIDGMTVAGTMTGSATFHDSDIADGFDGMNGSFGGCGFKGMMYPAMDAVLDFNDCLSKVPGLDRPEIDFINNGTIKLGNRGYHGGLTYYNIGANDAVTHESAASAVTLDATCVDGTFVVRGTVDFVDNSNGTIVDTDGLVSVEQISAGLERSSGVLAAIYRANYYKRKWDKIAGKVYIYDTNGTTVLNTFNVNEDMSEITPV